MRRNQNASRGRLSVHDATNRVQHRQRTTLLFYENRKNRQTDRLKNRCALILLLLLLLAAVGKWLRDRSLTRMMRY